MYSANTMQSFRYALNQILKFKGHEYDNTTSLAFLDSQKELKVIGKAEVYSAPEISEDGKPSKSLTFHDIVNKNNRNNKPKVDSQISVPRSLMV